MQLQIGLYMSILEDAFCRYELGKALPARPVKYDVPAVRAVSVRKPKSEGERLVSLFYVRASGFVLTHTEGQ
jgi:hypothetical protein